MIANRIRPVHDVPAKVSPTDAYVRHVEEAIVNHKDPRPPATRAELVAVVTARPDLAYLWWPGPSVRKALDLPDSPYDLSTDLDDDEKTRFARSLIRDPEFRNLIFNLAKTA